jgi:nicotinamide riboside kinase
MVVYGKVDDHIENDLISNKPDYYLLCKPDMPWEPDPLRQNENDRDMLFDKYESKIKEIAVPYTIIKGNNKERKKKAIQILNSLIN